MFYLDEAYGTNTMGQINIDNMGQIPWVNK